MDEHVWDVPTGLYLISRKLNDWNDEELQARSIAAQDSLKSVSARLSHAAHHHDEVNASWLRFDERASNKKTATSKLFRVQGEPLDSHEWFGEAGTITRSAHLVACVQALHSIPDTLAYAVYFCFELKTPARERDISVKSVKRELASNAHAQFACEALASLTDGGRYGHIDALSNHAKHRSIVEDSVRGNPNAGKDAPISLRFNAFTYETTGNIPVSYVAIDALPLLQSELSRMQSIVNRFGIALNAYLSTLPNRS